MSWGSLLPLRLRAVPPLVADGLLVAVVLAFNLVAFARPLPAGSPFHVPDLLGYGLVALFSLPLLARRRLPRAVLIGILLVVLVYRALGYRPDALGQGIVIAAYTLGAYCEPRASLPAHAAFLATVAGSVLVAPEPVAFQDVVEIVLIYAGSWWFGDNVRARRHYAAQLEERAAQLERARRQLADRAVAEERLRIARELHDVVAHSMSVIAVQSGTGEHVIESQPQEARKALAIIKVTSRAALAEMRRLLGVLRQEGETTGSLAPVAGLAEVDRLAGQVAQAGVPVTVKVVGERPQVPAAVDLSAYRIVQEALTNVLKHAGAASATVVIHYGRADVAVEVIDDGRGATADGGARPSGGGRGIAGMRERVALFDGDLDAGPCPGGGFRVAARLPFKEPLP